MFNSKGFISDSETRRIVNVFWLKEGAFNGKFYQRYPTFTTARLLQETEKAYLLAGKHQIEKFGFMKGVWVPKSAVQID